MDKSGFIYKNKRFNNEYVVMQVIPNPHDMDQSILYINSNQPRLFRQNLFTRKTILPSYANGLHPYWNNEALIFMNNKYYGIYEWGMNMEEIK
ncbi:MAG TPA: hypothetical protein DEB10_07450 [Ruminococcaceae bacterium]|nr:hypothetical protein [Oscillospiraceae bacterium]